MVGNGTEVRIDDECLFSNGIDICTTDFHGVYNDAMERINYDKNIHIKNGCWVGRKVYIGKGVTLPEGTIVGAYGVVTKSFSEPNTMIAGNPASVKKRNVYWKS